MIARDGVDGLTMRTLAVEAGTAVGLSYKAFSSRDDLLWELTWSSLVELAGQLDEWAALPRGDLGGRLMECLDIHQVSPAPGLVDHLIRGPRREDLLRATVDASLTRSWAAMMTEFLRARQRAGDVLDDVGIEAFGFIITAAMHHVLVAEDENPTKHLSTCRFSPQATFLHTSDQVFHNVSHDCPGLVVSRNASFPTERAFRQVGPRFERSG